MAQLQRDLGRFDVLPRRFHDHRPVGRGLHDPVIHLDGKGDGVAVVERDRRTIGAASAADVRVDVVGLQFGDAHRVRTIVAGLSLDKGGHLHRRKLGACRGDRAVHLVAHDLDQGKAGLCRAKRQGIGSGCVGREQARERAGLVVAGPVLWTHGIVGLEFGAARHEARPREHDIALVKADLWDVASPFDPPDGQQEQHDRCNSPGGDRAQYDAPGGLGQQAGQQKDQGGRRCRGKRHAGRARCAFADRDPSKGAQGGQRDEAQSC